VQLLFINFLFHLSAASPLKSDGGDGFIEWKPDQLLNWSNFKAQPAAGESAPAFAYTDIECDYQIVNGKIEFRVNAVFFEEESWVKREAVNDITLFWMQLCFDLTAKYAEALKDALQQQEFLAGDEEKFHRTVSKVKYQWQMKMMAFQTALTEETNSFKQLRKWSKKVDRSMELLQPDWILALD
jgi:hypothetical protein